MNQKKVLVAMSGGVDSAVCAYLIHHSGYDTEGLTMKLWDDQATLFDEDSPTPDGNCQDAAAIAHQLGIPHRSVSFGETFRREVIDRFISDYAAGLTPNPCVVCNKRIKFGRLMDFTREHGFDYLATGHYAKIEKNTDGEFLLKKAADLSKDQSYFLWSLKKEDLGRILFPLGNYKKSEIRAIAAKNGFSNAHRSDSQDICFVPDGDYISFIQAHSDLSFPEGDFVSPDGSILGRHSGLLRYTIGQRKGLGIALGHPAFVGQKDPLANTVTLCSDSELYRDTLTADSVNWLINLDLSVSHRLEAKIRYRHAPALATVEPLKDGRVFVCFDAPQRAIAPGQSVVFYDGDIVVGGGIIQP